MNKYLFSIRLFFVMCIMFITAGNAFSVDYESIANKTVNWKSYRINASDGWLGLGGKSVYKLIYNSGKEYGAIVLSDRKYSFSEVDYRKFIDSTYKKLASNPDNINVTLEKVTPYNVLSMKNAPSVVFVAKGKKFFTFLPYVDGHAYSVIAVSWHEKSKILPSYLIDMLSRITVEAQKPKQIISKFNNSPETPNKSVPIQSSDNVSKPTSSNYPVAQREEKVVAPTIKTTSLPKENNSDLNFEQLSPIYNAYYQEILKLKKQYDEAKTKQEKSNIKDLVKVKRDKLKATIAKFSSSHSVIGSNIPFKVVGDLPFTVQQVKVSMINHSRMEFIITSKTNQDIKDNKGKLKQRISIHFVAIDKYDKPIKGTFNWATNHGWVKLFRGTIYDAQGHWNAERIQNMGNFKHLKIMTKEEYDKMKLAG